MTKTSEIEEMKTEGLLKKALSSEVKWLLYFAGFVVGVVAPYYQIQSDIALIKQNHFAHMETMTKQIEENSTAIKAVVDKEYILMQKLAEVDGRVKSLEK